MIRHLSFLRPDATRHARVFVHIGPHKTGTTSIQQVLLNARRGIHYPVPNTMGPGHHEIAMSMTRAGSEPCGRTPLLEMIREQGWDRTGSPIVFSSETFSTISVLPCAAAQFAELADAMHVELVVTHRSIISRLNSFLQERVKNNLLDDINESTVLWSGILSEPAFEEDFFDRTVGMARWRRCHVVMVDKTNPRFLTTAFSSILGVALAQRQRPPEENASIPFPQLQMLLELHREEPGADNADLLARSAVLFAELRRKDPERAALPYPPIPRDVQQHADAMDIRQMIRAARS
jgi:hypothetical protein